MSKMNYHNPFTLRRIFDYGTYSIIKVKEKNIKHSKKDRIPVGKVVTYQAIRYNSPNKIFITLWKQRDVYIVRVREVKNEKVSKGYQQVLVGSFFQTTTRVPLPDDHMNILRVFFAMNGMEFYKTYIHALASESNVYTIEARLSVI